MTAPKLNVSISAELRASNGTLVEITQNNIFLTKPGARGGAGHQVQIPLSEWDAIHNAVNEVRSALARANALREEIGAHD